MAESQITTLINQLQATIVKTVFFHDIQYIYPLPPGKVARLDPPVDCIYKVRPQLPAAHPYDDEFNFIKSFRCLDSAQSTSEPPPDTTEDDLARCMDRLREAPGSSVLKVVSFTADDEIFYGIKLTTTWRLAGGHQVTEDKSMVYDKVTFDMTVSFARDYRWGLLLEGLMNRSTTYAYFHVKHHLQKFDPLLVEFEENLFWGEQQWDTFKFPNFNEMLCNNLYYGYCSALDEVWRSVDVRSISENEDHQHLLLDVTLSCGHKQTVDLCYLNQCTGEYLMEAHCEDKTCGLPMLNAHQQHPLGLYIDRGYVWMYLQAQNRLYQVLDDLIFVGDNQAAPITYSFPQVANALKYTLDSLTVPATIMPPILQARSSPDMILVFAALRRLETSPKVFPETPYHMLARINMMCTIALSGGMKPATARFIRTWLVRTVNYILRNAAEQSKNTFDELMKGIADLGLH